MEIVVPERRPFPVAISAGKVKIAKNRCRAIDVRLRRRPMELPAPAQEVRAQTRLEVERALGIPQPSQSELHRAGTGERNDVARDEHAGVDEGTAVAVPTSPLDERDTKPFSRTVIGNAESHDASADDQNMFAHTRCSS